jgi:hypothetical protein
LEPEGPTTEQGRGAKPQADNVIRLPKEWVGPGLEGPSEAPAGDAPPVSGDDREAEPVGSVREWLGGDEDLVQLGGLTGDAFWGGSAVAGAPGDERDRERPPAAAALSRRIADVGSIAARLPRSATWMVAVLAGVCVIGLGFAVLGGTSPAPKKVSRTASSRAAAATRAPVRGGARKVHPAHRRLGRRTHRPPAKHQPTAAKPVEATYAPSAPAPAPPSSSVDASAASGGGSGGGGGAATSSQAAGPVGPGALTGAGSTPSG